MAWSKLVDLELSDEEKLDASGPIAISSRPDYPWGTRICLTHRELKMLGLAPDCTIGDMIDMRCFGEVTSISQDKDADGNPTCRIEIQIQKMAVEDEMTESTRG